MPKRRIIIPILFIVIISLVAYWYLSTQKSQPASTALTGSGTVEATEVTISPEISGRVAQVLVNEGDQVAAGDVLFKLDGTLLEAQLNQAKANLGAAQAGKQVAQDSYAAAVTGQNTAQAQYNLSLAQALQQALPARSTAWSQPAPAEFDHPLWYYTHDEQVTAAIYEFNTAKIALENEQSAFNKMESTDTNSNLVAAEARLALARSAFLDAQDVLDRSKLQNDQALVDAAQQGFDDAKNELEADQATYNDLLTTQQASDILDGRARLAVAQERYDTAVDRYNALLTGRDSLQVQVAAAALTQAQSNVTLAESRLAQAQTAIDQAQAAVDLVTTQMGKLTITAPVAGVVLARSIEPGEVVQPGASALSLGELSQLTITVYLPENRYGEVHLGDAARVSVDSFPGQGFTASVTHIADQAQFTPRNVQTMEGRSTTVYAVQLKVDDPQGQLKPGMPADVTFGQP